jgi:hypothetical protein
VNRPAAEPQADFPSTRERCVSTMTIFELPAFFIAGTVEPAYEIGGDNFDYAISAHRLDGVG